MSDPASSIVNIARVKLTVAGVAHQHEAASPANDGPTCAYHRRVSADLLALARDIAPLAPCPCDVKEGV